MRKCFGTSPRNSGFSARQWDYQFMFQGVYLLAAPNQPLRFGFHSQAKAPQEAGETACPCQVKGSLDVLIKSVNKDIQILCRSADSERYEACNSETLAAPFLVNFFPSLIALGPKEEAPHARVHNLVFETTVEQPIALFNQSTFAAVAKTLFSEIRSAHHRRPSQAPAATGQDSGASLEQIMTNHNQIYQQVNSYVEIMDKNLQDSEEITTLLSSQAGAITRHRVALVNELKRWSQETSQRVEGLNQRVREATAKLRTAEAIVHYEDIHRKIGQLLDKINQNLPKLSKITSGNRKIQQNLEFIRTKQTELEGLPQLEVRLRALLAAQRGVEGSNASLLAVVALGLFTVLCLVRVHRKIGNSNRIRSMADF